jgi:hypothetical protein
MANFVTPAGIPVSVPAPVVVKAPVVPAPPAGFDLSSLVPWLVLGGLAMMATGRKGKGMQWLADLFEE